MGKYCQICGKGLMNGNNVSHSVRRTHRRWAPNTQARARCCGRFRLSYERMHPLLRSGKVQRAQ